MANLNNLLQLSKLSDEYKSTLVAVSKTKPNEDILKVYNSGQRVFGENKVQELVDKHSSLPKDIEWHMIGHLQRNKVKYIAPFVKLIHAVDTLKLGKEIDKCAEKENRVIKVLLQIYIADESSKFGFEWNELQNVLKESELLEFKNISICGVMGMATFTDNELQVKNEFKQLKTYFDQLKSSYFKNQSDFKEISMGMSGDYKIALQEGSTMIRVGSAIFGSR